jgi:hypothetical protein
LRARSRLAAFVRVRIEITRMRFLPARFVQLAFSVILSGLMSLLVTGVASLKNVGFGPDLTGAWMSAWAFTWPIAGVVIHVLAPLVRRLVAAITEAPPHRA